MTPEIGQRWLWFGKANKITGTPRSYIFEIVDDEYDENEVEGLVIKVLSGSKPHPDDCIFHILDDGAPIQKWQGGYYKFLPGQESVN